MCNRFACMHVWCLRLIYECLYVYKAPHIAFICYSAQDMKWSMKPHDQRQTETLVTSKRSYLGLIVDIL